MSGRGPRSYLLFTCCYTYCFIYCVTRRWRRGERAGGGGSRSCRTSALLAYFMYSFTYCLLTALLTALLGDDGVVSGRVAELQNELDIERAERHKYKRAADAAQEQVVE